MTRQEQGIEVKAAVANSPEYEKALKQFILFWGEMASNWGINKTMGQIHALLYAVEEPLDTDEIMTRLDISRGNANTNLRSLAEWQLIHRISIPGSRKDHYTAEKDVWKMCAQVIAQRQQKEVGPIKETLGECLSLLNPDSDPQTSESQFAHRIENLIEFTSVFEGFTNAFVPFVQSRNASMIKRVVQFASKRGKK